MPQREIQSVMVVSAQGNVSSPALFPPRQQRNWLGEFDNVKSRATIKFENPLLYQNINLGERIMQINGKSENQDWLPVIWHRMQQK